MRIIRPFDVNSISTNVAEDDYPEWESGTSYAEGDRRILSTTHNVYESLIENNTGNIPSDNADGASPSEHELWNSTATYFSGDKVYLLSTLKLYESKIRGNTGNSPDTSPDAWRVVGDIAAWKSVSATRPWRMFDQTVGDQTTNAGSIDVAISASSTIDSIALLNIDATSYDVAVEYAGSNIYSASGTLILDNIGGWYDYFFEPIIRRTELAFFDIPPHPSVNVSVTLDAGTGTAACGNCVIGAQRELGVSQWGLSAGIQDYSRKETDEFGRVNIEKRRFSRTMNADLFVDNALVSETIRLLSQYRTTPLVWAASIDFSSTIVYGFYRDFSAVLETPAGSRCNIEIEGLV